MLSVRPGHNAMVGASYEQRVTDMAVSADTRTFGLTWLSAILPPGPFSGMLQAGLIWSGMLVFKVQWCMSSGDNVVVGASSNEQQATDMVVTIRYCTWLSVSAQLPPHQGLLEI